MDSTELINLNELPLSDIGERAIESYTSLGAIGVGDLVVYMMEIIGTLRSTAHLSEMGWHNFEQIDGSLRELVLGEKYEDRQKTVKFDAPPSSMFPGAISGHFVAASGLINPVPSILTAPIIHGTPVYGNVPPNDDDDDIEFDDRFDDDDDAVDDNMGHAIDKCVKVTDETIEVTLGTEDDMLGYDHGAPIITDEDIERAKEALIQNPDEIQIRKLSL